jgi:hypothetical protein
MYCVYGVAALATMVARHEHATASVLYMMWQVCERPLQLHRCSSRAPWGYAMDGASRGKGVCREGSTLLSAGGRGRLGLVSPLGWGGRQPAHGAGSFGVCAYVVTRQTHGFACAE